MEENFIYAPSGTSGEFRCRVPLKGARQQFIVNGSVQGGASPFTLEVPEGCLRDEMLQLISVRNADNTAPLSTRQIYRFGKHSSGRILQCFHTFTMDSFETEDRVEIRLEEGAAAEFFILQNEHNKASHRTFYDISLARDASLNMVFVSLHGGRIENNLKVDLCGEHGSCDLGGLYLTDGKQTMINNVELEHHVPECRSNQVFKGILDDEGVARFYGRVKVDRDAQKTEAMQANHNIIISDKARAYSKPQLEIYADDVKCSHGSTLGRLDEEEIFYMRTRGIPEGEARIMQQMAFAWEVLQRISSEELRERMQSLVEKRLRGEFNNCRNCSKNCC